MRHGSLVLLCFACGSLLLGGKARGADGATQPAPATQPATMPADQSSAAAGDDLTHLSLEDLMNVEVTSVSKKKQSILDAPAAITVISEDDISRSGFSTIPDLLRLVPGMDVARVNSSDYAISVRGFNDQFADKLLVLQDGRSLYTPLFGGTYWETVDYIMADLDRIEVIRGPGATLWGANAVDGVINITSKDSRDTQGWLLSSRASNDDSNFSARYGGKLAPDTFYRAYIKTKYVNDLDDAGGGGAGDSWYALRGGFRIDKHPSDDNTLTLQGDITGDRARQPTPAIPPDVPAGTLGRNTVAGNMIARWDHRDGEDANSSLQIYYDYLKVDDHATNFDQHTFDVDFHDRFKVGESNEVSWGVGYRNIDSNIVNSPELFAFPETRDDNLVSAFVQDTYTLQPDRWFVTIGSKFEYNDYTGFEIQPSARLLWKATKETSVWGAISRAVSTPSRVNDDLRVIAPVGTNELEVLGNPSLQSEELTAYELGYRVQPGKQLKIDVTAFYNNYDRLKSLEYAGAPMAGPPVIIPATFVNGLSGDTYGGEISSTVEITDNWRLEGSYSLLQSSFRAEPGQDISNSAQIFHGSSPQSQAQLHSYLDITKNVQLNASVYYVGKVEEFNVPAYVSTDLNVAWKPLESLEVTVGILNLFDNHRPEFGVTGGQGIASEVPRTFYGQMTYRF
ncbi:MAG TPA: TonB-dependent receptor [Tepidisphaeraceae bacterium]|nr:TonB-dependent receptor [Tepidisphaeraceae bacterium]